MKSLLSFIPSSHHFPNHCPLLPSLASPFSAASLRFPRYPHSGQPEAVEPTYPAASSDQPATSVPRSDPSTSPPPPQRAEEDEAERALRLKVAQLRKALRLTTADGFYLSSERLHGARGPVVCVLQRALVEAAAQVAPSLNPLRCCLAPWAAWVSYCSYWRVFGGLIPFSARV